MSTTTPRHPAPPTAAQRIRLLELAAVMRTIAAPVGSMSGLWDPIHDCEAAARGEPTFLRDAEHTPAWFIAKAEEILANPVGCAVKADQLADKVAAWRAFVVDLRTAGHRAGLRQLIGDVPDWAIGTMRVGEIVDRWAAEQTLLS